MSRLVARWRVHLPVAPAGMKGANLRRPYYYQMVAGLMNHRSAPVQFVLRETSFVISLYKGRCQILIAESSELIRQPTPELSYALEYFLREKKYRALQVDFYYPGQKGHRD